MLWRSLLTDADDSGIESLVLASVKAALQARTYLACRPAPILEAQGFQVRVADSIASALQEVSSHKFDVLLSDLNISEAGDGFVVVKAARAANPLCVAILLTGYPDFESAVAGINCDLDGYLVNQQMSRCC